MQLLQGSQVVKSLNQVVRKPKLLKCGSDILKVLDSLDIVAGKRQNFEVLQALHWHDLNNGVRGQRQFLTVLKLVDVIVKSLDLVGQLADKADLGGLLGRDSTLGLPPANSFFQSNAGHLCLSIFLNIKTSYLNYKSAQRTGQ